ncbi:DHH family phosphoesterase [Treponema primitia]|uniref:DHH family phosphoesterase n=1 Tax=Treponema primitia TaxID=88058 RepID=UPI00398064AA
MLEKENYLNKIATYKNVVIQCHDAPDADAIGSGYALQCYLKSLGVSAKLIYGGQNEISKPNLRMLISALKIDLLKVSALPAETDLLLTVDCQYGASNVQKFAAPAVAVIDHHRAEIADGDNVLIRPSLASCATLVWDLLRNENFEIDKNYSVCNALYYGLFTDTNELSEMRHPLDRDLSDLPYDAALVRKLKNSAITLDELTIVSNALKNYQVFNRVGLFQASPCDQNLLGFTSSIAQQIDGLDCCVAYCVQPSSIKLSIRCCTREIMANEFAAFLCAGVGSGGGNLEKAGGAINAKECLAGPAAFLTNRIKAYLTNFELIYAENNCDDFSTMRRYRKLPIRAGFARSTDIFPLTANRKAAKITIRTLEGDIDITVAEDIYLMIGIQGEVYPIRRERFEQSYIRLNTKCETTLEYSPTVTDQRTGKKLPLIPFAENCLPREEKFVRARELRKDTKVFSSWDNEKYFLGRAGDFFVVTENDFNDCYVITKDIFRKSYTEEA